MLFVGVRWLSPLEESDRALLENNIDALLLAFPILAHTCDRGHLLQSVLDVSSAWARHAADSDDRHSLADRHLPLSVLATPLPNISKASSHFHFGPAQSVSQDLEAAAYTPGTVMGDGRTAGHTCSIESAPAGVAREYGHINAGQAVDAVLPLLGPLRVVAGGDDDNGDYKDSDKDLFEQVWGPTGGDGEDCQWEQGRQPTTLMAATPRTTGT